ncbi:alpha-L-fucosidase [Lactobacillus sp. ESL0677]|uniref:alpha-L-fucosidase n=1 Tax=Lactobacillus sp. ESL0677 TaxID=2983208 RepID=UPI0023F8B1C7|nr:alpha-L-fucosidase [Lactobacillus sp. ESL0677]WEV36503.1 alpha-L-fucosidase [Lactobacillus sp. ESL0677]
MTDKAKQRQDIVENLATQQEDYQDLPQAVLDKLSWFQDQKLGIIFHWGLYSQAGIVESWQLSKEDDWARKHGAWRKDLTTLRHDYWNLNREFNPVNFNPSDWAKAVKAAGFKYMLFTTKHHDGFSMYDTKYSNYKITSADSAFHDNPQADLLRFINDAFRKEGMATGAYYSKADWHCPYYWEPGSDPKGRYASYNPKEKPELWHKFSNFVENQLLEICQNYGPIDILWLDGGWVNSENNEYLPMAEIVQKIWQQKPDTLIVDRTIGGKYENYVTPEQKIPDVPPKKVWESNITLAKNWGYVPHDQYKSFAEILKNIVKIISLGGNVILGVGPKPDGTLPKKALALMQELGTWLKVFGEAVYGSRGCPELAPANLLVTKKGQTRYLFFAKDEVGQKVSLASLGQIEDTIINLETGNLIKIIADTITIPQTKYPYGVLKLKIKE